MDYEIISKKQAIRCDRMACFYGSPGRIRTSDQLINSQLLYR